MGTAAEATTVNTEATPNDSTTVDLSAPSSNLDNTLDDNLDRGRPPGDDLNVEYDYMPDKFMFEGKPDYEKLATSYKHLEGKLGEKTNVAPDSIDDYKYEYKNAETFNENDEATKAFKEDALAMGISSEQYNKLMGWFETHAADQAVGNIENTTATLKEAWGGDYSGQLGNAQKAFKSLSDDTMDVAALGNNVDVMKMLAKIGSEMGEDSNMGVATARNTGMTVLERDELMSSDDYWTNKEKQKMVANWYSSN